MKSAAAARTAVCAGRIGNEKWSDGRVARQRSAKPCTAVRIRFRPHQNAVVDYYNGVFFLICTVFVRQFYIPILIFSNNARSLSSEMFDKTGRT